jgi:hypothetical protein
MASAAKRAGCEDPLEALREDLIDKLELSDLFFCADQDQDKTSPIPSDMLPDGTGFALTSLRLRTSAE